MDSKTSSVWTSSSLTARNPAHVGSGTRKIDTFFIKPFFATFFHNTMTAKTIKGKIFSLGAFSRAILKFSVGVFGTSSKPSSLE